MNSNDYFKKFEKDPEYQEAEQKYKLILDLADEILRLRMEKGWSQAELAKRAETKQANISRLENGMLNPSVNFLQKVAKALDTDLSIHVANKPSEEIYEGIVEHGKICLKAGTKLPEDVKVYVVVTNEFNVKLNRKKPAQILSPRLAVREQAADFKLTVTEEKPK
ncbi:MAG TPA: helix-turn-helix domain-containing protein [Anaerolineales bacterium]|nr:helix-turn-helix domain-containing protein [Anaerolineales bacterium]